MQADLPQNNQGQGVDVVGGGPSWHYEVDHGENVLGGGGEGKWVRRLKSLGTLVLAVMFFLVAVAVIVGLLLNYEIIGLPAGLEEHAMVVQVERGVGDLLVLVGLK